MARLTNHIDTDIKTKQPKSLMQVRQKINGLLNDGYNWIYMIALAFSILGVIFRYMVRRALLFIK